MSDATHWIDGAASRFADESTRAVVSPFTGKAIAQTRNGSAGAVEAAVDSALRAFAGWRRSALEERVRLVLALAARVEADAEGLARQLVAEAGKTLRNARLEVRNLLAAFRYFCDEAPLRIPGFEIAGHRDFSPRVVREPVGVVAAIAPFNFPVQLLSWKLCPAVLSGCSVVAKPDPRTPLSTLRLAEWATEVGWPPGLFNVVLGDRDTGARLAGHRSVAKIAFTGSVAGGRAVYRSAAEGLKRVTLDLGGCSPLLVCGDADLARWMPDLLQRSFYNSGQYCFRINRALVERTRYDEFVARFAEAAAALVVGDPEQERTDLGPQKIVVVVDEDVDVRDPATVLWALSSRVDFDRDVTLQERVPLFQRDPAAFRRVADGGTAAAELGTKWIIDATVKARCMDVALPARALMERARAAWAATGLPPLAPTARLDRLLASHGESGIEFEPGPPR